MLRVPIAVLVAAAALVAVAGPAAAYSAPQSDYGNTVQCRYRAPGSGPSFNFRLKSLVVTAPVVYAHTSSQKVGWRFVVTRSTNGDSGPWQQTFRSPIQTASATQSSAAPFSSMKVGVALPNVENLTFVRYHVTLKLIWYRANGQVQSRVSYLMPYMTFWQNGVNQHDWDNECEGGYYQGP